MDFKCDVLQSVDIHVFHVIYSRLTSVIAVDQYTVAVHIAKQLLLHLARGMLVDWPEVTEVSMRISDDVQHYHDLVMPLSKTF